jgi:hypothetical protein
MIDLDLISQGEARDKHLSLLFGAQVSKWSPLKRLEVWKGIRGERKVHTYNPIVKNGEIDLQKKTVDFPAKFKVKRGSKRLPQEVKDALPIKTSKTCKWVGQTPFAIGFRPQKHHCGEENFFEFLSSEYGEKHQKHFKDEYTNMTMVAGSWPTCAVDISKAAEHVPNRITYQQLLRALDFRKEKIILPKIKYIPNKELLWSCEVSPNSFSGVMTSRLFGNTKKKAFLKSTTISETLFSYTKRRVVQDTSLWGIGGRERPNSMVKDGEAVRSRAIWMPEMAPSQLAQLYSRPIQKELQVLQKHYQKDIEVMCGASFYGRGWDKFVKRYGKRVNVLFADWSRHDQTVSEETMTVAFSILRSCFPKSQQIDNHFQFIMSGFIHKHVAIPGRFVYKINKGIPSGSPFTTLITTICCWLEWSYVFMKLNMHNVDLSVYGDDTIAGLELFHKFPDDIVEKIKNWLGMNVDPFEISMFTSKRFQEENANFLQTYDYHGLPGRSTQTTLRLLMLPKKRSRGYYDNSFKVTGTIYTGPGNHEAVDLICDFRDWCRWKSIPRYNRKKDKFPLKNMVGPIAKRISQRVALINYLKTPIPWVDKDVNTLWWLNKESYSRSHDPKLVKILEKQIGFGLKNIIML